MTVRTYIAALALFSLTAVAVRAAEPPNVQSVPLPATWSFSTDGGKTFSDKPPEPVAVGKPLNVIARGKFTVDTPASTAALFLSAKDVALCTADKAETGDKENLCAAMLEQTTVKVNGKSPAGPLPRMIYDWLPLHPDVLAAGENVIEVSGALRNYTAAGPVTLSLSLAAAPPQAPKLLYGPVLGAFGDD